MFELFVSSCFEFFTGYVIPELNVNNDGNIFQAVYDCKNITLIATYKENSWIVEFALKTASNTWFESEYRDSILDAFKNACENYKDYLESQDESI